MSTTDYDASIDYDAVIDFDGIYEDSTGGGGYFYHPYTKHKEELYLAQKRQELQKIDSELILSEQAKQNAQARIVELEGQETAVRELAALQERIAAEINRLRMERVWLMRQIDDEEAILALLMARPLIH